MEAAISVVRMSHFVSKEIAEANHLLFLVEGSGSIRPILLKHILVSVPRLTV